ncbi:MAG: hypothetical protein SVR94_14995 [Pseudomonadota bacterium]|nr:hypothetical protein [Pseudomonadota bacterium]
MVHATVYQHLPIDLVDVMTVLMEDILGTPTVKMILNRCQCNQRVLPQELVYTLAQETQKLLGNKGAYASLRQVGRSLAKNLIKQAPPEEWSRLFEQSLNDFGYAQRVEKKTDRAFICQCVFYERLTQEQLQPIQHAVCWIGWGFIEGFMKTLEHIRSVEWAGRDIAHQRCEFIFKRTDLLDVLSKKNKL